MLQELIKRISDQKTRVSLYVKLMETKPNYTEIFNIILNTPVNATSYETSNNVDNYKLNKLDSLNINQSALYSTASSISNPSSFLSSQDNKYSSSLNTTLSNVHNENKEKVESYY